MSISEFVACDADYDAALRFAGSLPDGTDVEHTPVACWPDVVNRRIAALEQEVAELRAGWTTLPCPLCGGNGVHSFGRHGPEQCDDCNGHGVLYRRPAAEAHP